MVERYGFNQRVERSGDLAQLRERPEDVVIAVHLCACVKRNTGLASLRSNRMGEAVHTNEMISSTTSLGRISRIEELVEPFATGRVRVWSAVGSAVALSLFGCGITSSIV